MQGNYNNFSLLCQPLGQLWDFRIGLRDKHHHLILIFLFKIKAAHNKYSPNKCGERLFNYVKQILFEFHGFLLPVVAIEGWELWNEGEETKSNHIFTFIIKSK
jgi:hypothetical protein